MPYYVDSPVGAGLGFAAAYLQGKQQRAKDQRDFSLDQQQQEIARQYLALQQAAGERSAKADDLANTNAELANTQRTKMMAWDAAHPAPDPNDAKAFGRYAAQRENFANSIGFYDQAKETAADFRTGQQATEYGANASYTSGAKTDNTRANTRLTDARTRYENEHANNEKRRFQHELDVIRQRDGDAAARALQTTQMRIGGMLQANGQRIAAQYGIANMNNQVRDAISMRAATLSSQFHSDEMSLQAALTEYRGQMQSYLQNDKDYAAGKPTDPGFQPGASMPVINISGLGAQQNQQPQIMVVPITLPNGQKTDVQIPVPVHHKATVTTQGAMNPAQFHPQQKSPVQNILDAIGGWLHQ